MKHRHSPQKGDVVDSGSTRNGERLGGDGAKHIDSLIGVSDGSMEPAIECMAVTGRDESVRRAGLRPAPMRNLAPRTPVMRQEACDGLDGSGASCGRTATKVPALPYPKRLSNLSPLSRGGNAVAGIKIAHPPTEETEKAR